MGLIEKDHFPSLFRVARVAPARNIKEAMAPAAVDKPSHLSVGTQTALVGSAASPNARDRGLRHVKNQEEREYGSHSLCPEKSGGVSGRAPHHRPTRTLC